MNARLSLPRSSLRDYFTAFVHEFHHSASENLQHGLLNFHGHNSFLGPCFNEPGASTSQSVIDKGKARAIDAIDSVVDSMLLARAAVVSAIANSGLSPIGSSTSAAVGQAIAHDPADEDVLPPVQDPSPSDRPRPPPRPPRRKQPSNKKPGRNTTSHTARVPMRPLPGHDATRQPIHTPWDYNPNYSIRPQSVPGNRLNTALYTTGQNILQLSERASIPPMLSALHQLYADLDSMGRLETLKSHGIDAFPMDVLPKNWRETDAVLLLRHLITTIFFDLRARYRETTGNRWEQRKAARRQVLIDIEDTFTWLFRHPPLASLISFRNARLAIATRHCIMSLDRPAETAKDIVEKVSSRQSPLSAQAVYQVFILALVASEAPLPALDLYEHATQRRIEVREVVGRKVARVLSVERDAERANQAFRLINEQALMQTGTTSRLETKTLQARASHNSRIGRSDLVDQDLDVLAQRPEARSWVKKSRIHLAAEAAAARGEYEAVLEMLHKRFDFDWSRGLPLARGKMVPSPIIHARRLSALLAMKRVSEAEDVLTHMLEVGLQPPASTFNLFMAACIRLEDVVLAQRLLHAYQRLYPFGTSILVSLIHLFARRQDVESAKRVLQFIMGIGHKVPIEAYNALMLAYLEASDWEGAFKHFQMAQRSKLVLLRPNPLTYRLMLRALVLSGASIREVLRFVELMKSQGQELDERTYGLVMQSACDAGAMGLATEMFDTADESLKGGANVVHFSIIINGFLRAGQGLKAKEYFDLMQERGLVPTPVTYAMLVQQHARMGTDEDIQKAIKVASWALSELDEISPREGPARANVAAMLHLPILRAEVNRGNSVAAEETFGAMGQTYGLTAIRCLTILLDLYRRDGRIQAACEVWQQLVTLACAEELTTLNEVLDTAKPSAGSGSEDDAMEQPSQSDRRLRNPSSLCLPLSIIMDALSKAGLHDEAVQAWMDVRELGGVFDPDNWNVLMAVHAEAGRLDVALQILDSVLREVPPNWARLRQSETMGRFTPHGTQLLDFVEATIGRKGLAQLESRRSVRQAIGEITPEEPDVESGDAGADEEDRDGSENVERDEWEDLDDEEGESSPTRSRPRRERDRSDPDLASQALRRSTSIDKCFWFAHDAKLAVVNRALQMQGRMLDRDGDEEGDDDPYVASEDQAQGPVYITSAELQRRFPNAARALQLQAMRAEPRQHASADQWNSNQ
ncbi:hypothetical protein OC846_005527 [Tilletia horrida]|uniref:Pentatricopeptide repeat-containing protein-mitochondrial domain-containing protein n=1 Tax=Tilletia horrida TaxID=155126 RepID=A0AAN6GKM6_9BASI|nr:hypothetical protein OC846_005527 [Tilletia horrida]